MPRVILPPIPNLKFQPTGKWDEAVRELGQLDSRIKAICIESQIKVAKKILKKVKGHLINQDLGWRPLNVKYKRRKEKLGLDPRILIATQSYWENIQYWHRKNGWQVFIGVKPGVYGKTITGKRAKLDIATIAAIQEFGRDGWRRRQLWVPTIRELGNTPGIRRMYIEEMHKAFINTRGLSKYVKQLKRI